MELKDKLKHEGGDDVELEGRGSDSEDADATPSKQRAAGSTQGRRGNKKGAKGRSISEPVRRKASSASKSSKSASSCMKCMKTAKDSVNLARSAD